MLVRREDHGAVCVGRTTRNGSWAVRSVYLSRSLGSLGRSLADEKSNNYVPKRWRYSVGVMPKRRSNVLRNTSSLWKPTDVATLLIVQRAGDNLRRASSRRAISIKTAGVLPSADLNRLLNCLGDR